MESTIIFVIAASSLGAIAISYLLDWIDTKEPGYWYSIFIHIIVPVLRILALLGLAVSFGGLVNIYL